MIVLFEEIKGERLLVEQDLEKEWLAKVLAGEGPDTGFRPASEGAVKAEFEKVLGGSLLLRVKGSVKVMGPCKRCLAQTEVDVPLDFQLSLVKQLALAPDGTAEEVGPKDEEGLDASFDLHAVEEEVFDGKRIDLDAILREQLLLALPMDTLCQEGCKGLCAVCGKELNKGECCCERKPPDPRWAALKGIKL